jgi:hypothetical protein
VIRDAGGKAELDLYKGVPHVFQAMGAGTPESNTAMSEAKSFFRFAPSSQTLGSCVHVSAPAFAAGIEPASDHPDMCALAAISPCHHTPDAHKKRTRPYDISVGRSCDAIAQTV